MMFSIALIGADGAGKTTIANKLLDSFPLPMKYLYMGMNINSSNIVLPTSRLVNFILHRESIDNMGNFQSSKTSFHYTEHREYDKRGKIGAAARLLYRLAEEWFRQFVSWSYQLRGYIVLYDRHFFFDFAPSTNTQDQKDRLSERLHRWCLNHLYVKPNLVIFLDAPPEVLFIRKREKDLIYLRNKREEYLRQGKKVANFVVIDATQPLDKVYADISQHIMQFYKTKNSKQLTMLSKN